MDKPLTVAAPVGGGGAGGHQPPSEEFLLREYEHVSECFLQNEEGGEKSVNIFLTITTALAAGLAFGWEKLESGAPLYWLPMTGLTFFWLLLGFTILRRLVRRNLTTDEHLRALARIRRHFVHRENDYCWKILPYDPYKSRPPREASKSPFGKGGYVEILMLLNAMVACAGVWLVTHWKLNVSPGQLDTDLMGPGIGLIAALLVWGGQRYVVDGLYREDTEKVTKLEKAREANTRGQWAPP